MLYADCAIISVELANALNLKIDATHIAFRKLQLACRYAQHMGENVQVLLDTAIGASENKHVKEALIRLKTTGWIQ